METARRSCGSASAWATRSRLLRGCIGEAHLAAGDPALIWHLTVAGSKIWKRVRGREHIVILTPGERAELRAIAQIGVCGAQKPW